ncbi:DUF6917 domain-containing protein [Streptomyces minutiscleroticus]|uniref:DUF6917 domain-containing protein n=1 Tax=Streptomyces minutiscleroticus TaxID=68238 RepID=A0A918NU55_9ACTN|nr:hypothetical protein [Streptomyces minutiscleroticus]GGX96477.1 hypothetical protein GCM10010358_57860 [Streptomyces minutiscleroticus]
MSGPGEDGAKREVRGVLVKVLLHRRTDRGMTLEPCTSRCVRRGELHELVVTDQIGAVPGERVDRVGFLGFAELTRAGVVDRGDGCWIGGERVGTVLGFDACHFPNHYNIVVAAEGLPTGGSLGLRPELQVVFTAAPSPVRPPDTAS